MQTLRHLLVLASGMLALTSGAATQPTPQPSTPGAALARLFTAKTIEGGWFAPVFLAQVPVERVQTIVAGIVAQLGAFERADPNSDGTFTLRFERGTNQAQIHLDAGGRIDGLFFRPPQLTSLSLDAALAQLAGSPGVVSYIVIENGRVRAAREPQRALAVGSTFKLAILRGLVDRIARGALHWDETATLPASDKSLPSGILQTWPDGAPLTLATLATLMISQSDNTAADVLARVVGPSALAPYAMGNEPFPTTRELFIVKADPVLRAVWRSGDSAARRRVLAQADARQLPALASIDSDPADLDIEWHYSVQALCDLIEPLASLPLMAVNPGLALPDDWARVAYKGGSDIGVINLTTALTAKDGRRICVSATENNPKDILDDQQFGLRYGAVLASLRTAG
ncbi:MAG: serine hydrolase [Vulcanimicrobiaceae bacterium]